MAKKNIKKHDNVKILHSNMSDKKLFLPNKHSDAMDPGYIIHMHASWTVTRMLYNITGEKKHFSILFMLFLITNKKESRNPCFF